MNSQSELTKWFCEQHNKIIVVEGAAAAIGSAAITGATATTVTIMETNRKYWNKIWNAFAY